MDRARLLTELEGLGFGVERDGEGAIVSPPSTDSQVALQNLNSWIRLSVRVADPADIEAAVDREALERWMVDVQGRYLGCRFAYDPDGALGIVEDVYPSQQNGAALAEAINQVVYVAETLFPLIEELISTGKIPSDEEVDVAFSDAEVH